MRAAGQISKFLWDKLIIDPAAIDRHGNCNINTASDFIAQYSTRLEYKSANGLPDHNEERENPSCISMYQRMRDVLCTDSFLQDGSEGLTTSGEDPEVAEVQSLLFDLERRALAGNPISIQELRDTLRRAVALLCGMSKDECSIVQQLVGIPFILFTKQSIKLGISLWLGVINENSRMEPRILAMVAENWEKSVRSCMGVFSPKLGLVFQIANGQCRIDVCSYLDPFCIKEEFAPSEKTFIMKQQQAAHNLIAPHLRLLHFLTSHFTASRLGSRHSQHIFHRVATVTLDSLKHCTGHPLAREFYYQTVLFGLNVFRHCTNLDQTAKWRLKDSTLTAGLAWFAYPPRYVRDQLLLRAELKVIDGLLEAIDSRSKLKPAYWPMLTLPYGP